MDCINILDAKQAIIKLLKDYDRNNRKERCSEVLVKIVINDFILQRCE